MNEFKIEIKKSAEKELLKIPKVQVDSITIKIRNLSKNPFSDGTKKLKGIDDPLYRIGSGDYRIVYSVNRAKNTITIQSISHRKDIYKNL